MKVTVFPNTRLSFKLLVSPEPNPKGRKVITAPGVDFGRPPEIVHEAGDYVVARHPGHTSWAGVGTQAYRSTFFEVLRLGAEQGRFMEVCDFGGNWRKALVIAQDACEYLAQHGSLQGWCNPEAPDSEARVITQDACGYLAQHGSLQGWCNPAASDTATTESEAPNAR